MIRISNLEPLGAMQEARIPMIAYNLFERWALFDNGVILPIVVMFDSDGDATFDPDDCVSFDFGDAVYGYGTSHVTDDVDELVDTVH